MANMKIRGVEGMSAGALSAAIQQGGRLAYFQYCLSMVIMTFKRASDIRFTAPGTNSVKHGVGFTLTSLMFGGWGIPWGPIYTISTVFNHAKCGVDVTHRVMRTIVVPAAILVPPVCGSA